MSGEFGDVDAMGFLEGRGRGDPGEPVRPEAVKEQEVRGALGQAGSGKGEGAV